MTSWRRGSTPRMPGSASAPASASAASPAPGELTSDLADRRRAARPRARRHERQRSRSDRAGDRHPRPDLPVDRRQGAGAARHEARRRVRRAGGVLRLHLRARRRRQRAAARPGPHRAGDRRRNVFAHPRLAGSRHLRAVRRRRRRARAERGPGRAATGRGILSTHLHSDGRQHDILYVDGGPSSTGTAGCCAWKGAKCSGRRSSI